MAKCIVCIELENADQRALDDLHRMLLNAGLAGTIRADSKAEYRLPSGTYSYDGPLDKEGVRDSLKVVIGSLGHPYGLLVTEGASVWNLLVVKEPPAEEDAKQDQDKPSK